MAGFMITAASSGSGKTMITCGLLELFKRKGLNPLACKCGPDYIDGLVRLVKKLVRHHDDAGAEADKHIRPQAGPAVFHAALHAENTAEEDRQNDPDGDFGVR